MAYWVFNILQDHSKLSVVPPNEGEFEAEVIVEDFEKTLRAKKDDRFLTLNKNGSYNFDNHGKIVDDVRTAETPLSEDDIQRLSRRGISGRTFQQSINTGRRHF